MKDGSPVHLGKVQCKINLYSQIWASVTFSFSSLNGQVAALLKQGSQRKRHAYFSFIKSSIPISAQHLTNSHRMLVWFVAIKTKWN